MNKTIIAFDRGFILPPTKKGGTNYQLIATIQAELMNLGYILAQDAYMELMYMDAEELKQLANELITRIKTVIGDTADHYRPIYEGFPEEVMIKSDITIFFERILHYWSDGHWIPKPIEISKPINFETVHFTEIRLGTEKEFESIFANLVTLPYALTGRDKEVVMWFVKNYDISKLMPERIPFKETMAMLAAELVKVPVQTPTDVMRIAGYMSWGDTDITVPNKMIRTSAWSSAEKLNPEYDKRKFRKFNYDEKQHLLSLLEATGANKHELAAKKNRWIRLGERLKPGRYKDRFPKSFAAFDYIRNEKHPRSWKGMVDMAFKGDFATGLTTLAQRPGEFARSLDAILRRFPEKTMHILMVFINIAEKVSNRVLFSLIGHFENRLNEYDRTVFVPKAQKRVEIPTLAPMDAGRVKGIQSSIFEALKNKYSLLDPLGYVWLDPELKNIALPLDMRNVEDGKIIVAKGTKIPLQIDSKVIRMYLHWTSTTRNNDLDLGARFYGDGKDTKDVELAYSTRGLKLRDTDSNIFAVHSGDVRHRIGANAEYIDVDIEKARKAGYRYIALRAHDFEGGGFEHWNATVGFMGREFPESNKTWLPKTVENSIMLTSSSSSMLLFLFDLDERTYTMIQEPMSGYPIPTEGKGVGVKRTIQSYLEPPKFSVWHLLKLHVDGRGMYVENLPEDEETLKEIKQFKAEDFQNYEKIAAWVGE